MMVEAFILILLCIWNKKECTKKVMFQCVNMENLDMFSLTTTCPTNLGIPAVIMNDVLPSVTIC